MVYLSRIYTRTGDNGETALGDGHRVSKDHPRVTAYGTVDEVNAVLGVLLTHVREPDAVSLLRGIQNDLFDVGADLCLPPAAGEQPGAKLRIQTLQIQCLEEAIDRVNQGLTDITSFVLPGGNPAAAWCHLARTVCRRAERHVVALMHAETVNGQVLIYLNRLSDLLFVLARKFNDEGKSDVLWVPGGKIG